MSLGHIASQAVSGVVPCLQKCVVYLVDIFIWSIYFLQLKTHCPVPRAYSHQSWGGSRARLSSLLGRWSHRDGNALGVIHCTVWLAVKSCG